LLRRADARGHNLPYLTPIASVKVAPSSGVWWTSVPLSAMLAVSGSWKDAGPPPASPPSPICPRRRGEFPSAAPLAPPALSLRGTWLKVLRGPASREEEREGCFPPLACLVADEGGSTCGIAEVTPLTWELDRVPIPSRYLIDWVCVRID